MVSDWLTRQEAAEYLRVSVRQLSRLSVPRTMLGSSPRFSRASLDTFLQARETTPGVRMRKPPVVLPQMIRGRKSGPTTTAEVMARLG